jgi:predicted LPLAT superfamily acyltransferase
MSIISLLNEQLKNNLNKTTKDLIISMSEQFKLPHKDLLNIWNELNPEFKHNFNHVKVVDEEVIIVRKPRVEDEEVIIVKKPRVTIEGPV